MGEYEDSDLGSELETDAVPAAEPTLELGVGSHDRHSIPLLDDIYPKLSQTLRRQDVLAKYDTERHQQDSIQQIETPKKHIQGKITSSLENETNQLDMKTPKEVGPRPRGLCICEYFSTSC